MGIARTILAAVIAVSVAVMPAAAGAVAAAGASRDAFVGTADSAMPVDCAHHNSPADRGSKGADDCGSLAACAVKCFNYVGSVVPGIATTPKASRLLPVVAVGCVASNIAAPPFRPPRV